MNVENLSVTGNWEEVRGEKRVCGLNTHLWILDISFSVCVSCSIPFIYSVPLDVSLYLLGLSFYIYKMGSLITAL